MIELAFDYNSIQLCRSRLIAGYEIRKGQQYCAIVKINEPFGVIILEEVPEVKLDRTVAYPASSALRASCVMEFQEKVQTLFG